MEQLTPFLDILHTTGFPEISLNQKALEFERIWFPSSSMQISYQYVYSNCYFPFARTNQHTIINITDPCDVLWKGERDENPCSLNYDIGLKSCSILCLDSENVLLALPVELNSFWQSFSTSVEGKGICQINSCIPGTRKYIDLLKQQNHIWKSSVTGVTT